MKPIYLVIQAFGPFAGRHVVDFRHALDCGLFGIYGSTGSGKSSIFNAMTFALFGEAVKEEVDNASLRSHHAAPNFPTQVEFVFAIGERQYRVVRSPKQERPKKSGIGTTNESHKASLFDVTGKTAEVLNDQDPGSLIAEGKVEDVNLKVETLLGYKAKQFRQIVLLPQGRFETFLTADTSQRMGILRELFDVSLYRSITERMKERADDAEKEVRRQRDVCDGLLQSGGFTGMDALATGIEEARKNVELKQEELTAFKTQGAAAFAALQTAVQQDKSFKDYAAAISALNGLKQKADAFAVKRERVSSARKAQTLVAFDDQVRIEHKGVADLAEALANARALRSAAEKNHADREKAYALLAGRKDEFEQKRALERDLLKHRETLLGTAAHRDELTSAIAALDATNTTLDARTRAATRARDEAQKCQNALDAERGNQVQRAGLRASLAGLNADLTAALTFETKSREIATTKAELTRQTAAFDAALQSLEAAKAALTEAESALFRNHAALLAGRLTDGEPCLVCGSRHHPSPAEGGGESERVAADYESAREKLRVAQDHYDRASVARATAQAHHARSASDLADLKAPAQPSAQLRLNLQAAEASLKKLGVDRDLAVLEATLGKAQAAVAKADADLDAARQARDAAETCKALANQRLEQALASIPNDLRDGAALDRAIDEAKRAIQQYDTALKTAEEAKDKAKEAFIAADRDATNAESNLAEARRKLAAAQSAFDEACAAAGLSTDAYQASKPFIASIEALEEDIRHYATAVAIASEDVRKAEEATKDLDRPDIDALKKAHDDAEQAQKLADEACHGARHVLQTREKLLHERKGWPKGRSRNLRHWGHVRPRARSCERQNAAHDGEPLHARARARDKGPGSQGAWAVRG